MERKLYHHTRTKQHKSKHLCDCLKFFSTINIRKTKIFGKTMDQRKSKRTFNPSYFNQLKKKLSIAQYFKGLQSCEGRIKLAPLPYEAHYPILLNPSYKLTELIVVKHHKNVKHVIAKQILMEIRQ